MAIGKGARQAFSKRVLQLREERGLTQIQLGRRVGVSGTCVWNWETGNTFPRSAAMTKLADALGTSVDYLSIGNGASKSNNDVDRRSLNVVIEEAREAVANAAGVPISKVRVVLDYGD